MKLARSLLVSAYLSFMFILPAAAEDCPPGSPCLPAAPSSVEVNSHSATSSGALADVGSPGVRPPLRVVLPAPAVAVKPLAPVVPSFPTLSVPLRYQDPSTSSALAPDVSCGVQALGMALSALPGSAPTSTALLAFLQGSGMMYDFGTGVEELAFAAQSFGYKGALPFHGADLSTLVSELAAGRPVVVSLGANGEGQPGHFVTVTGISPEGDWIAYSDPTFGKMVVPTSEFMRLWGLQGNSGVVMAPVLPPAAPDPMPWVALAAGIMALVSTSPLGLQRKGIGGRIISGAASPSKTIPPKPTSKPAAPAPSRLASTPKYGDEPPDPPMPTPTPKPPALGSVAAKLERQEEELVRQASPPLRPSSPPEPTQRFDTETAGLPVCTLEPRVFIGTGPTTLATSTPVPPITMAGTLDAGCVVAGSLDRFQKNPAFVGTNVGIGSIVDSLDQGLQAVPPDNPLVLALKLGVSAVEAARNTLATPYNFVCQQVKKQGTYYEILPLDEMAEDIEDRWNQMSLAEKAVTVAIGVAILETVVVLVLPK